jgi:hypothetical protein
MKYFVHYIAAVVGAMMFGIACAEDAIDPAEVVRVAPVAPIGTISSSGILPPVVRVSSGAALPSLAAAPPVEVVPHVGVVPYFWTEPPFEMGSPVPDPASAWALPLRAVLPAKAMR